MERDYKEIYENMKKNSIGPDKKCKNIRIKKEAILKIALPIVMTTLITSCCTGLIKNHKEQRNESSYSYTLNGFTRGDITCYEQLRVNDLLLENGFIDYNVIDNKKDYKYTKEDYEKIEDLDETYLYGFYITTTKNTTDEVSKALGYNNLNDYLNQKGYIKEDNQIDMNKWINEDNEKISKIMENEQKEGKIK